MSRRWVSRSSEDLAAEAVGRYRGRSKYIGIELRRRDPSEGAALPVIAAVRQKRVDAWEAAFLLGCIRHEVGYETVCEILADPHLSYADGYVATALLEIDAIRAEADLVRFVEVAASQEGRDEAARGLGRLRSPSSTEALLRAATSGRIRTTVAGRTLVDRGLEPSTVAAWLNSGKRSEVELGCEVVARCAWRPPVRRRACRWTPKERDELLLLAREVVERGLADPKPYIRTALRRQTSHRLIV